MTSQVPNQLQDNKPVENKPSDKELNFRALEAKLAQERAARLEAEKKAMEIERMAQESQRRRQEQQDDDDNDDEPYIDKKRLQMFEKNFERRLEEKIEKKAEEKARKLLDQEKRDSWLRNNPDFYDIMQHAEDFANHDPELAETILQMPEGFERQKLVYKNIKALGLHKPKVQEQTIQQKIDANRRSPYYQPSGISPAPYSNQGDFSASGQKNAYDKMQELKKRLRI